MQNSSITWSWKSSNDGSVICNCQYVIVSQINTISDRKCSTTEQVTLRVMRCVGSVTKKQVSLKLKKKSHEELFGSMTSYIKFVNQNLNYIVCAFDLEFNMFVVVFEEYLVCTNVIICLYVGYWSADFFSPS